MSSASIQWSRIDLVGSYYGGGRLVCWRHVLSRDYLHGRHPLECWGLGMRAKHRRAPLPLFGAHEDTQVPITLEAHTIQAWNCKEGLGSQPFVAGTFAVIFMHMQWQVLMMPEMDRMKDSKNEMCSGFKEFSYTVTALGHPAGFADERSVDEALSDLRQPRCYWILRRVIDLKAISETRTNVWVDTLVAAGFSGPGSTLLALTTADVTFSPHIIIFIVNVRTVFVFAHLMVLRHQVSFYTCSATHKS